MRRPVLIATACVGVSLTACGNSGTSQTSAASSTPSTTNSSGTPLPTTAGAAPGGNLPPAPVDANPAGDIPDTQAFVPYTLAAGAYSVVVPEGWSRAENAGVTTFSNHFNSIRLETQPSGTAPTVTSARSNELPAIRRQQPNVSNDQVSSVNRRAGAAILITYQTDSSADPVTGKRVRLAVERYEFWRSGSEAILTLSSPVGSDNVDPWRRVTDSFQWR